MAENSTVIVYDVDPGPYTHIHATHNAHHV
jgi:hypothetical protein